MLTGFTSVFPSIFDFGGAGHDVSQFDGQREMKGNGYIGDKTMGVNIP
jgi:hypothetical protein